MRDFNLLNQLNDAHPMRCETGCAIEESQSGGLQNRALDAVFCRFSGKKNLS
jgi:hypothetical protein